VSNGFFENIGEAIAKTIGVGIKADLELKVKMGTALMVIKRDAIKNCPKLVGHLRRSITTDVTEDKGKVIGEIGSNLEYAVAQEFGTENLTGRGSGIPATFFMSRAVKDNTTKITAILKK